MVLSTGLKRESDNQPNGSYDFIPGDSYMNRVRFINICAVLTPMLFSAPVFSQETECIAPGCHENFREMENKHPILEEGCDNCHELTDEKKHAFNLMEEDNALCLLCHEETAAGTVVHGAIEAGGCTMCHDPHGSGSKKMLTMDFPEGLYAPWSEEAFALCFSCHEVSLVANKVTTEATSFRNGDKNLHSVHVGRPDKGRSCKICHFPHTGPKPALLRDRSPFGKWKMSISWDQNKSGGSCSPSCHKRRIYDRSGSSSK